MNPEKFLTDREAAAIRKPTYDGWYWWRASENSEPVRYMIQFDGKQATSEHGGTVPTSALGGEWGHPAPDPEHNSQADPS
jgi:hypothetical protein